MGFRRRASRGPQRPPPPALFPRGARVAYGLAAVGFAVALYGASLPWYWIESTLLKTSDAIVAVDYPGARVHLGEAFATLTGAVVGLALCGFTVLRGVRLWLPVLPALAVIGGPLYTFYQRRIAAPSQLADIAEEVAGSLPSMFEVELSLGAGFWVTCAAGLVALLATLLGFWRARTMVA